MIEIPKMVKHNYLNITAGFIVYTDPRANYYLCQGLTLLLSYKPIIKLLISKFGLATFEKKRNRIMEYFKLLSIVRLYYDEKEKDKQDTNIVNSKTFKEIVKIQGLVPLILVEIWELLIPIIENTDLGVEGYKEHHFRSYRDKKKVEFGRRLY